MRQKTLRTTLILFLATLFCSLLPAQEGFVFDGNAQKDRIKFKLINNLVIIPVEVNGLELSLLLDSGASNTVIFSLEERDSLMLHDVRVVELRGLSKKEPVEAIRSDNNRVRIGKAQKEGQTIFVAFDGSLHLSTRLGVPVHGIIGYDFLSEFVVQVSYTSKRLKFFTPGVYNKKPCRKCVEIPIELEKGKPYLKGTSSETDDELRLLIDSGSGDALWFFEDDKKRLTVPEDAFEDYLGTSINGPIYGMRTKTEWFSMAGFGFENVNTSYPDAALFRELGLLENRHGSVGGELLSRFRVTFDYPGERMVLKKNNRYNKPFYYNMSGLTLEHGGLVLARELERRQHVKGSYTSIDAGGNTTIDLMPKYRFSLERSYVVAEVRQGSPAERAGIREGDEILWVNGRPAYRYALHELTELFYSKEGKTIRIRTSRNGVEQMVKFELEDI